MSNSIIIQFGLQKIFQMELTVDIVSYNYCFEQWFDKVSLNNYLKDGQYNNVVSIIKMQQSNKNKQERNKRLAQIRLSLKKVPILHKTTDRVHKMIKQQRNAQRTFKPDQTSSVQFNEQSLRTKSQNKRAFEAKFEVGKKIGQGAHGYVKQCFHRQTGNMYALKIIPSDREFYYYLKRNFVNITELDHPNVIKYKAFYFDMIKQTCLLVMDYLPHPNLNDIVIEDQEELKKIIYEVILGLQYVHNKKICHRDIKPDNILYDKENQRSILIDFGVSCKFVERGTKKYMLTLTGTPYYRAPQMFMGGGYDQRVDLWALGVTIYQLITKVTPFQSQYHSDTINNILKGQVNFQNNEWNKYSHLVKNLVNHLLKPKQTRLSIKQAKNHFWFSNLREQQQFQEQMTKSANFTSFLTLKRTTTQQLSNNSVRTRNPTLSPVVSFLSSPKMFSLQRYQREEKNMRWISLQESNQMDLIQSEDQQSTSSPSPRHNRKREP